MQPHASNWHAQEHAPVACVSTLARPTKPRIDVMENGNEFDQDNCCRRISLGDDGSSGIRPGSHSGTGPLRILSSESGCPERWCAHACVQAGVVAALSDASP